MVMLMEIGGLSVTGIPNLWYFGVCVNCYWNTITKTVVFWHLCHISGVQRSVVRVGRVVARFNKTKEGMAIGGIEAKVADQT